jgi:hypothetical protein
MGTGDASEVLEAAERQLGVRLPESFRSHLLRGNGGEVTVLEIEWDLTPAQDIAAATIQARHWPGFPPHAVAIGDDGCGNHLVFLPNVADRSVLLPALFVWWHEGGEIESAGEDFAVAIGSR